MFVCTRIHDNSIRATLNSIEKRQAVACDNDYKAPIASIEFDLNGSMVSHKQRQIPRIAYCVMRSVNSIIMHEMLYI